MWVSWATEIFLRIKKCPRFDKGSLISEGIFNLVPKLFSIWIEMLVNRQWFHTFFWGRDQIDNTFRYQATFTHNIASKGFTEFWDHIWEADSLYCTKYFNNVGNFYLFWHLIFSLWQSFSLASRNVICKKKLLWKADWLFLCFVTKQFQRVLLAP